MADITLQPLGGFDGRDRAAAGLREGEREEDNTDQCLRPLIFLSR